MEFDINLVSAQDTFNIFYPLNKNFHGQIRLDETIHYNLSLLRRGNYSEYMNLHNARLKQARQQNPNKDISSVPVIRSFTLEQMTIINYVVDYLNHQLQSCDFAEEVCGFGNNMLELQKLYPPQQRSNAQIFIPQTFDQQITTFFDKAMTAKPQIIPAMMAMFHTAGIEGTEATILSCANIIIGEFGGLPIHLSLEELPDLSTPEQIEGYYRFLISGRRYTRVRSSQELVSSDTTNYKAVCSFGNFAKHYIGAVWNNRKAIVAGLPGLSETIDCKTAATHSQTVSLELGYILLSSIKRQYNRMRAERGLIYQ